MSQSIVRIAIGVGILGAMPAVAAADDGAVQVVVPRVGDGWHLAPSVSAGVEDFRYHEEMPAPMGGDYTADKHAAVMPTTQLALEASSPGAHLYARASLSVTGGSMQYVGQTQAGDPLSGPSTGLMTNAEAVFGMRGRIGSSMWLGGYLGVGHRTWDRDLRPVGAGGYLEQYSWNYAPVGVRLDAAINDRLTVALDGAILVPGPGGNLHASHLPGGIDDMDVDLEPDYGARIRVSGAYAINGALRITAAAGLEATSTVAGAPTHLMSNGQPVTDGQGDPVTAYEPYSYTTRLTLNVGAAYGF
jgi:hypothetical protein